MDTKKLKRLIDIAVDKYRGINPITQKLINLGAGIGIGGGLGSISLGKDSSGKKRGYLINHDKVRSILTGAMAGGLAANHIPLLYKNAQSSISEDEIDEMYNDYVIRQKRISAIKAALLAAAAGGIGGGLLTAKGGGKSSDILGAGIASAAGSGALTYLLNRFS